MSHTLARFFGFFIGRRASSTGVSGPMVPSSSWVRVAEPVGDGGTVSSLLVTGSASARAEFSSFAGASGWADWV
jgi:hypothetical protein